MNEKAVLMSIHKEWLDKIISGKKSLEIRSRYPKTLRPPFHVFFYETRNSGGCGNIRAKATCVGVVHIRKEQVETELAKDFLNASCLSQEQLHVAFSTHDTLYGLVLQDVQIENKDISYFGIKKTPQGWQYCKVPNSLTAADRKKLLLQYEAFAVRHKKKYPDGWFEGVVTWDGNVIVAEFSHNKTLIDLYGKTEKEIWKEMPVTAAPLYWLSEKTKAIPVYNNGYLHTNFVPSNMQRYVLGLLIRSGFTKDFCLG